MKANPLVIGALLLVCVFSLASTLHSCTRSEGPDKFYEHVGERAGKTAGASLNPGDTVLLLRRSGKEGVFETMIEACASTLEKRGVTVHRHELPAFELEEATSETSAAPSAFREALKQAKQDGHALKLLVSFVGVPPGTLGRGAPPVFVVAASEGDCRAALERKHIVGALAMKPWDRLSGQAISTKPRERFDQTCVVLP